KAGFEKGYREFIEKLAKTLSGKPLAKKRTLAQLREAVEKDPDDLDAAAALAASLLNRSRYRVEARRLAEGVLEKKKAHPGASLLLAHLARLAGDIKQERALLESARDADPPDPKILLALGKSCYEAMEFAEAVKVLEKGRQLEPHENE